jgi:hypothetical protein
MLGHWIGHRTRQGARELCFCPSTQQMSADDRRCSIAALREGDVVLVRRAKRAGRWHVQSGGAT